MQLQDQHLREARSSVPGSSGAVFARGDGHLVFDEENRAYLDFFSGGGVLNYGHSNPELRSALDSYLRQGSSLSSQRDHDVATARFAARFRQLVLAPRDMNHLIAGIWPTGARALEQAYDLAMNHTGRRSIVALASDLHGSRPGMLYAGIARQPMRSPRASGAALARVSLDLFRREGIEAVDTLEEMFFLSQQADAHKPAAIVVGNLPTHDPTPWPRANWWRRLQAMAHRHGALVIADERQIGCGRTGPFFGFEDLDYRPDLICLSKALSGYGLPLAMTLARPELVGSEGNTGSRLFRDSPLALAAATRALELYWSNSELEKHTRELGTMVTRRLRRIATQVDGSVRGRGLFHELQLPDQELAERSAIEALCRGLLVQCRSASSRSLQIMPPLTIDPVDLEVGLDILERSIAKVSLELATRAA